MPLEKLDAGARRVISGRNRPMLILTVKPTSRRATGEDAPSVGAEQDQSEPEPPAMTQVVRTARRPRSQARAPALTPVEKDLREGAVADPPQKDFGEFEPDM